MIQVVESVVEASEAEMERWTASRWYALYTKGRHEKFLDCEFQKRRIETFLPVRKIMRHWSDRKKIIIEPLFKSYLFVRCPWKQRFEILNTKGAVCFVTSGLSHAPIEVPERDLFSMRRFAEQDIPMDPFPYLREGEKVYIKNGPFKGVEGFVVRKDSHCRLVISLDLLMQSVSVQVDEAMVEKA
jgi:transcription antitermination factor NusG